MGGYGSTRWNWHSKANTVEECFALDVAALARRGWIRPGARITGCLSWTCAGTPAGSIGFTADAPAGTLRLFYAANGVPKDGFFALEHEPCRFGGNRWFLRCSCGRRVLKLYLPRSRAAVRFACRVCHRLTYTSAQEHDARLDALRRDPETLVALLHSSRDTDRLPPRAALRALQPSFMALRAAWTTQALDEKRWKREQAKREERQEGRRMRGRP